MWYEVKKLKEKGFSNSRISRRTGLDRKTVRRYLNMGEEEFHQWISSPRKMPLKLGQYIEFVRKELEDCAELSAAQIEDHLKEHFADFPKIHSKTIYNLVKTVRERYNLLKPKISEQRIFEKIPETSYGQMAQVDFGEAWLQTEDEGRKKVYFFVMVLTRSRYKYVYFSEHTFTSKRSVEAHNYAFEYFEGVPREILYDQDSVFIHDENLGDYQLTEGFGSYCKTQSFRPVFCRKSDPQSKGKVENVVKYIKQNFLRGRKFKNIEILQNQALEWLERTGNEKVHSGTKKVPKECWEEEKKHLLPIKNKNRTSNQKRSYNVRKDNTIVYKSNYYSLPAGTYKKQGTKVFLEVKEGKIYLYSSENKLIAVHRVSIGKGEYIRNTSHQREKTDTLEQMQTKVLNILGQTEISRDYLKKLQQDKSRYYRDNLREIIKRNPDYKQNVIDESIMACIEAGEYNAYILLDVMKSKNLEIQQNEQVQESLQTIKQSLIQNAVVSTDIKVEKSNINKYEEIF